MSSWAVHTCLGASQCGISAVLDARSRLLVSTLPAPEMSTSPTGLSQTEDAPDDHPTTIKSFDVAPAVKVYVDSLPATPARIQTTGLGFVNGLGK